MDLIKCIRHQTSRICQLYLGKSQIYILCDQCLDENIIKDEIPQLNKIISIKKIFNQPELVLQRLNLDDNFTQLLNFLGVNNKTKIDQIIKDLENSINTLIEFILKIFNDFKTNLQQVQDLKQQLLIKITENIQYDNFTKTLSQLIEQNENINQDAFYQIQEKLSYNLQQIQQNLLKEIPKFDNNIRQIQLQVEADVSILQQFQIVNQNLFKFSDDLQKVKFDIFSQYQKSHIIDNECYSKIYATIQNKTKKAPKDQKLIYLGSRDKLTPQSFWSKVNGKSNLLMIFKSENNYICGGFSPCQWQQNLNNYVQDRTNSSFLFSQTHNQFYHIKSNMNRCAIYCRSDGGPSFGGGHDIYIDYTFQNGSSYLGDTYHWEHAKKQKSNHLFGDEKVNIQECEIIQIIF